MALRIMPGLPVLSLRGLEKGRVGWRGLLSEPPTLAGLGGGEAVPAARRGIRPRGTDAPAFARALWPTLLPSAAGQFASVANVAYPAVYERFLGALDVLSFDLGLLASAGCLVEGIDFHDRLLTSTLGPAGAGVFLMLTYGIARWRYRGSSEILREMRLRHTSALLLVTFLVYSSVSSMVFSAFSCERLDDGRLYLRADYRIECDSPRHRSFQAYAAVMIFLYPLGIPFLYAALLCTNREDLVDDCARDADDGVQTFRDLWKPYKPTRYYYEVVECGRRISLTGIVVFIYPDTAAQVAVTLVMAFGFHVAFEALAPYESRWDTWISRSGHVLVFASMYEALLLKVDVSSERSGSQQVFAGVLVAAHACLVLAAVVEAVAIAYSIVLEQVDEAMPRVRVRSMRRIPVATVGEIPPFDDVDFCDMSASNAR